MDLLKQEAYVDLHLLEITSCDPMRVGPRDQRKNKRANGASGGNKAKETSGALAVLHFTERVQAIELLPSANRAK